MAAISVLNYNINSQNSNLKQVLPIVNNNNSNAGSKNGAKIATKRNIVMVRKRQKVQPLTESNANIMGVTSTITATPVMHKATTKINKIKSAGPAADGATKGAKGTPLPMAVARRNARERNRVKQVNNGFAALRERIPEEVAEAFEAQGNGRGSAKKLSKVETLRMAVEYIRSLEKVLANDTENCYHTSSKIEPIDPPLISAMTTPPPETNHTNSFEQEVFVTTAPTLPDLTIINGHQYVRIPGTNTYQLFTNIYQNDENLHPLTQDNITGGILLQSTDFDAEPHFITTTDIGYTPETPIHIMTPASVSPSTFSAQSLSPTLQDIKQEHCYVTLPHSPGEDSRSTDALYIPSHSTFEGVLTLKTEIADEDMLLDQPPITSQSMMDVMEWWDSAQHQQNPTKVS